MSKHTPGEWVILPEEINKPYLRIRGSLGHRYRIANVFNPNYEGEYEFEKDESHANARLIAAAPDLLEVLEQFVAWVDAPSESAFSDSQLAAARAAIAKAKGEQA